MTVRTDQFMMALLKWKNLPVSSNNVRSLVIWKVSEGSNARWNPMDTEWGVKGATNYNSAGVKNYATITDGIEAFWATLEQPQYAASYGPIITALEQSDAPAVTCAHIAASVWGSKPSSSEIADVLSNFEFYASMPISGSAAVTEPTIDNTPGPVETPAVPAPKKKDEEPIMIPQGEGGYIAIVIAPTGDILEITRKVGTAGEAIIGNGDISVVDITAKYPEFKGE